jgi:hypothetical protein
LIPVQAQKNKASQSKAPKMNTEEPKWKHVKLTKEQKAKVLQMTRKAAKRDLVFTSLINNAKMAKVIFPVITVLVMPFLPAFTFDQMTFSFLGLLISFFGGILVMTLTFILLHMRAHAKFLEYDMIDAESLRMTSENHLYWAAFLHHHVTETDNWGEEWTYYDKNGKKTNENGNDHILMSHWAGFSLFGHLWSGVATVILCAVIPNFCFFIAARELTSLFIPAAHAFEHLPRESFAPWMYQMFEFLVKIGVFATSIDHAPHHYHESETVYQSFSSSGISFRIVDKFFDSVWNTVYHLSEKQIGKRPFDLLNPVVQVTIAVITFVIPSVLLRV